MVKNTMNDSIVIHYGEIGLKGKNRSLFEKKLMENIQKALGKSVKRIYRLYGRIICDLTETNTTKVKNTLKKIPGIAHFSFIIKSNLKLNDIKKNSLKTLKDKTFSTFKVISKRSNKNFAITSQELNQIIGEHIVQNLRKKVNLTKPDLKLYIEICEKEALVYDNKHFGIGGLPIGTNGKLISSISGGLDSPVASFRMMKRGCEVIFVHVFNETIKGTGVLGKLTDIVAQLTNIQLNSKLYIVPFGKIQKQIITNVPSKFRMIIYRRFMMRICNTIAQKENAKGIITGDSVGQVASQTIENLRCIYAASDLPVFAPLIGADKEEIIKIAKDIGTYEYSISPYPDCCSFMVAKHPELRADVNQIEKIENLIKNKQELIEDSVSKAEIKTF